MSLLMRPLRDALIPSTESVPVNEEDAYQIAGIYSFGRGLIRRPTITGAGTSYKSLTPLSGGQLVMSKLNAWEGALAIVPDSFSGSFVSTEYPVFNIDTSVAEPLYINYLISWPQLWKLLTPRGSMVRRKRTSPAMLLDTIVPLPSDLDEQRRVAVKLEAILSSIKEAKTLSSASARTAESLLGSIIPTGVKSITLANLVDPVTRREATDPNKTYRMLGVKWYAQGAFVRETKLGSDIAAKSVFRVERADFIYNRLFGWKGSFALISENMDGCHVSNEFPTFRVNSSHACLQYIMLIFRLPDIWQTALAKSSGSTPTSRNRLKEDDLLSMEIPLPDLATQSKIAAKADMIIRISKLGKHRQIYADAFQGSILNAAFTGRL